MRASSRCSMGVRYRNFPVGTSMIFRGVAELSFTEQVLMRFRCRFKLYRDENDSMHRSHQCRFPAIRSVVIRCKALHTLFIGSLRAGLLIEYTPFDILYTW